MKDKEKVHDTITLIAFLVFLIVPLITIVLMMKGVIRVPRNESNLSTEMEESAISEIHEFCRNYVIHFGGVYE